MAANDATKTSDRVFGVTDDQLETWLRENELMVDPVIRLIHDIAHFDGKLSKPLLKRIELCKLHRFLAEDERQVLEDILEGASTKPLKRFLLQILRQIVKIKDADPFGKKTGWIGMEEVAARLLDLTLDPERSKLRKKRASSN
jgi:flagellar biosynthesis component FlhA